ncbi:MAG TPA: ATP-binding protein [Opitutaceae bacterium]|nr:ATP-binding protein [Opitutaceae bacterium]
MESIGVLATGIAHDLNNILTPIMMAVPLMREWAPAGEAGKILEMIEQNASRGASLVRQLTDYARGTGGARQTMEVSGLLAEIGRFVRAAFPKNIEFRAEAEPGLPAIRADGTQIYQVLLNLCVNARDAMPDGGVLRLVAKARAVRAPAAGEAAPIPAGSYLELAVEDTGRGIVPEVLAHIWEPFFTTKQRKQGSGLGLSTVRSIIRSHHGFIDVRSTPGEGTQFSVYLPAQAPD